MQKVNKYFVIILIAVLLVCTSGISGFFIGRSNSGNNSGIGNDFSRERELLDRIGEYEQRERTRIDRENSRIARERERIERTEIAIGAIRQLDRRTSDLLAELTKEIDILANFFRDSIDILNNDIIDCGIE